MSLRAVFPTQCKCKQTEHFSQAGSRIAGAHPEVCLPIFRPLRVVHSALCNRVLLNLRKAAACMPSQEDQENSAALTTVVFHDQLTTGLESSGETLTSYTIGELGYLER